MLTITLLGTAATMPLPDRALSAAFAACGGHGLLWDCGEGTQAAARRAGVNLMRADAICLTHYHGDHIFGLPGLLQTLGAQGRTRPLALLGPEGLPDIWAAVRALTGPLPYPVKPQVLMPGQPLALDALSEGWPAGARLVPFATKHRVKSLGYRLELPRAGKFSPEQARTRWGAHMLRALGIKAGIARNSDEYVRQAVELVKNTELREQVRRQIKERAQTVLFNGAAAQASYEEQLLRIHAQTVA